MTPSARAVEQIRANRRIRSVIIGRDNDMRHQAECDLDDLLALLPTLAAEAVRERDQQWIKATGMSLAPKEVGDKILDILRARHTAEGEGKS